MKEIKETQHANVHIMVNSHNINKFKCKLCGKDIIGGAYRVKQHLVGGYRNVTTCPKLSPHFREEVKEYISK